MTDKEKFRKEVKKLKSQLLRGACSSQVAMETTCKEEAYNEVLAILDTMQEEPVSSIWHDASEPPIIDKTFLLVAPNGNSSLCLWGGKQLHSVTIGGGHSVLCKGDIYSYIDDLLNLSNVQRTVKNWKEPVSEDLEEAATLYAKEEYSHKNPATLPDRCIGCYAPLMYAFKAGANWQKEQFEKNRLAACDRQTEEEAEREQDFVMGIIEKEHRQPTFDDAIKYGMRLQRENMMKDATDVTVHIEAGNYPYIPQMELYDYDNDVPIAKEGDKYKVVLIKE